jgi:hypothetical protein
MATTVSIEVPADRAALVQRFLALHEELAQLALDAPEGTVLDACETTVLAGGRDLCQRLLTDAVARRVGAAEKRGPRSACAPVDAPRKTAAPRTASS